MLTTTNQAAPNQMAPSMTAPALSTVLHHMRNWFAKAPQHKQPDWLRDARDEDLIKVGLTREALVDALVQRRAF